MNLGILGEKIKNIGVYIGFISYFDPSLLFGPSDVLGWIVNASKKVSPWFLTFRQDSTLSLRHKQTEQEKTSLE